MNDFLAETTERLDKMLDLAERNGWNAAINAARNILPLEHSLRIRALYKFTKEDRAKLRNRDFSDE